MTDRLLASNGAESIELTPQDIQPALSGTRILSVGLSLAVIGVALLQVRTIDIYEIFSLLPASPVFWLLFVVGYMAGPISEWIIFRSLWGVSMPALGALTRKLAYNELLLGYLGEAWFYAWARKHGQVEGSPFGAVKDVAVLSAMAGNILTLALLLAAIPYLDVLPLGDHATAIGWSLAFVVGTTGAAMIWRRSVFSLDRNELTMIFAVHVCRIIATTLISAALWYSVLPNTPIEWWLVLAAFRLLISRLPFLPNKDVAFAAMVAVAVGNELQITSLIALMAGLILMTNLIVGLGFSAYDLMNGEDRNDTDKHPNNATNNLGSDNSVNT